MPENKIFKIEKSEKMINIAEHIPYFIQVDQLGQGLKMLTPNQILSRLPISLAQLKTGDNSEKRKNEIRQILYPLYRSKKLTKNVYNNLINTI